MSGQRELQIRAIAGLAILSESKETKHYYEERFEIEQDDRVVKLSAALVVAAASTATGITIDDDLAGQCATIHDAYRLM